VQIWVEEGNRPPPRFSAVLNRNRKPRLDPESFDFKAPEGARQIEFQPAN
jgi:hypothetical protein